MGLVISRIINPLRRIVWLVHLTNKVPYNLCRSPSYFANHQVDRLGLAADGTEPIKLRSNYRLIRRSLHDP